MGWIPQALASALQQAAELNVKIDYNDHSFIIIMNDYGDLRLNVLFTSRQIIIETIICPLSAIQRQDLFNAFILRHQKLLPLSSVAISRLKNDEYYVAFGACRSIPRWKMWCWRSRRWPLMREILLS